MVQLLQNIARYVSLSAEEEAEIMARMEIQDHKSKTILQSPGQIAQGIYFVNSGILRSFIINDNIIEHVLHFACEGWWMGDMYSYLSGQPGHLFIEVLENAELVCISKENHQELYEKVPKLERFFRILAENSLVTHQERLMDNLSLSAEERFEKFYRKYPSLLQQVPQKHIASYIGVTPEFFSKMKSRILHKK